MEKILKITGMHCKSCELVLTDVLSEIKDVSNIAVDYSKGTVKVSYTDEKILQEVQKAIESEGYKVAL